MDTEPVGNKVIRQMLRDCDSFQFDFNDYEITIRSHLKLMKMIVKKQNTVIENLTKALINLQAKKDTEG